VSYELQTSTKVFNIAAAAHTAKILNTNVNEIINHLNNQLIRIIQDEWVDITTYTLDYPLNKPTKAKHEIIKTLDEFGSAAQTSIHLLNEIIENENKRPVDKDTKLIELAKNALQSIKAKRQLPMCCQKDVLLISNTDSNSPKIIDKEDRNSIPPIDGASLIDQNGDKIDFNDLTGKPFILTFFYTSCSNALKCASTIEKLTNLQKLIEKSNMANKVSIYAMTYDPDFDTPEVLKRYGKAFGVKFTDNFKFLIPVQDYKNQFFNALDLKVNYGVGSVNHHGTQLFVCDHHGNIAVAYQNTIWKNKGLLQKLKIILKE